MVKLIFLTKFLIFEKVIETISPENFRHQQCMGKRQRPNEFSKKESQQKIKVFFPIHNFSSKTELQILFMIPGH